MSTAIAKYVGKKILNETAKNKFGEEDPYYEKQAILDRHGRPTGKTKRRKKPIPAGISEHDAKVLTKVRRRAYRLDLCLFNFLGIRFGWSSVIGIIPVIGDAIDALMALMVYRTCTQVEGGLPGSVKMMMLFNIALDFGIGLVPFIGDLGDAIFRANTRNAITLERYLLNQGKKRLGTRAINVTQNEEEVISGNAADWDEYMAAEEPEPPPRYASDAATLSRPEPAWVKESRGGRKQRIPDEEIG